jgi:RNA polymerase sigma factor (sigma-70 family)
MDDAAVLDSPHVEARFSAFAESHLESARRLAWRLVGGDTGAAEDVVQNAFIKAWRGIPGFRGEARLETWFYRILVREAANHRRWRGVRDRFAALSRAQATQPAPEADPALRDRLLTAIETLSRGQRETFVLVHLEGFSVREAAAMTGRAEGTAKQHLHRALRRLREELADLAPGKEEP